MEEENGKAYAQQPGRDGILPADELSSPPHRVEKKKKKKKSKHPEVEDNSTDSPDGEHGPSSLRTDEVGEEKILKKRKSKKKSKEDREHHSSRKRKTEETDVDEARILGGNADGDHCRSGQPKRTDDDVGLNARKPASHSSLGSGNQAFSNRTNSTSESRPTESASAASNLSQFERDVRSKNEARRSERAATAHGVVSMVEDDGDKPRARPIGDGQPKRADNDVDMNARKPASHSSLTSGNQAFSSRTNSTSGSRPTESASAVSNLSQFERDVHSKNEARRSARAATAPGIVSVAEDDGDKPHARSIGAIASTRGSQYGKTSGRSSQSSAARSTAAASAVAGGGGASLGAVRSLRTLEDDVVAKVASAAAGGSRVSSRSMRSDLRTPEDNVFANNRVSSETNVTVVDPSARSRPSPATAVAGAALVGGVIGAAAATSGSSSNQAGAAQAAAQLEREVYAMNQAQGTSAAVWPPEPMTTFADVETPDEGGDSTDPHVVSTTRHAAEIHPVADNSFTENDHGDEEAVVSTPVDEAPDMSADYQYPGVAFAAEEFANEGAVDAFVADNVVDALGVAVVISEEEEEKLERRKYKRYLCFAFLCMCLIAVAIVVPVVLVVGEKKTMAPTIAPSEAPSMTPSVAPTSIRLDTIIEGLIPVSGEEAFMNRSSPQYLAADWVADLDPLMLSIEDPKLVQRYILAVFYFSMNGDEWESCGRNDRVCAGNTDATTWLSDSDECTWLANRCKDNANVDQIFFSKYAVIARPFYCRRAWILKSLAYLIVCKCSKDIWKQLEWHPS